MPDEKEYKVKSFCRIPICISFFLLITCIYALAQSNDRIDELLRQDKARLDSTAYIILAAGGIIQETDGTDVAYEKAVSLGLVKAGTVPDSPVRVDEMSYMLMKSLSLKGGVMYALFPGTRYAYRELAFRKAINVAGGPARIVSGEEVMRALGNVIPTDGGAR